MASQHNHGARLERLEKSLADVMHRLRALEDARHGAVTTATPVETADSGPAEAAPVFPVSPVEVAPGSAVDLTGLATLLGRSFIVFGGAYLLRALTESGRLPGTAGIIIGLAYAMTWLLAAHRDGLKRPMSGEFHGVTAMLVGLPLVWEATSRFGLLGPGSAALVLAAMSALAFAVAKRGRLDAVAGMAGVGTMATALVLAYTTNHHGVFSLLLTGLSTATYWLSDSPGRAWLRWPNAIAAGLAVAGVTARALATPALEPIWLAC